MLKFIMNAYIYGLTLAFTKIYFCDVKYRKRLTDAISMREWIGQIFKVVVLELGYTRIL